MLIPENMSKRNYSAEISLKVLKPRCQIMRTIFKIKKGGTQTDWPKYKKIDDDVQGLTSKRWDRTDYICQKKIEEEG